jgi:hypothetical protein
MCPICGQAAEVAEDPQHDAVRVRCDRCAPSNRLTVSGRATRSWSGESERRTLLSALSAYVRQASDRGERVLIDDPDMWVELARAHAQTSAGQKIVKTLQLFATRSPHMGAVASIDVRTDYPAVDAVSPEEIDYLVHHLNQTHYVDERQREMGSNRRAVVTPTGWEVLEPLRRGVQGRCFVAMACDPSLDQAYVEGILAAVKTDCGCDAVLIEKEQHNDKICDRALSEIRRAEFVVADVTLHRQNVYFEAGFALGLGREVIWTCREDEFSREKQHFDTRQYPHILWKGPFDLRTKLRDRIRFAILKDRT